MCLDIVGGGRRYVVGGAKGAIQNKDVSGKEG